MKSRVRKVTEIQVHFFFLRRILVASTSHCSSNTGNICSMEMISSLKVVSTLKPFTSSGWARTGESSSPLAYLYNWCPAFSPSRDWTLSSRSCARSPMVLIPASISFFSDTFPRNKSSLTGSGHIFIRNFVWK